jgi:hypothetical protein
VKLARLRRPKATCSLLYVEYRPNTNIAILWHTGHHKGRSCRKGVVKLRTWTKLIYPLFKNEYRNLRVTETTIRNGLKGEWRKLDEVKLIGVTIHKDMEISQGNSLCSYLYVKLKCIVFHFIFSLFCPTKSEEGRTNSAQWGGLASVGEERVGERG